MKKYTVLPFCLLAVCMLSFSCSKEDETPNYDGSWYGTTSQGKSISFTVSGNSVKNVYLGYNLSGTCSARPIASQLYSSYSIKDNSFAITGDTKISGTFSSSGKASGSFSVYFSQPGCSANANGTWSVTK